MSDFLMTKKQDLVPSAKRIKEGKFKFLFNTSQNRQSPLGQLQNGVKDRSFKIKNNKEEKTEKYSG